MSERSNEASTSCIDMYRNVNSSLGLVVVEYLRYLLDWLVMTSVSAARITKMPIVFSSMFCFTSSGSSLKWLFSETFNILDSTSKYLANFSSATCAFEPMIICDTLESSIKAEAQQISASSLGSQCKVLTFGFEVSFPSFIRFSCQRLFIARPPRWMASELRLWLSLQLVHLSEHPIGPQ